MEDAVTRRVVRAVPLLLVCAALALVSTGTANALPLLGQPNDLHGAGTIGASGDTQDWMFGANPAGGMATIRGTPAGTLQMVILFRTPASSLRRGPSAAPGSPVTLLDLDLLSAGTYTVTIEGAAGTIGSYQLEVIGSDGASIFGPAAVPEFKHIPHSRRRARDLRAAPAEAPNHGRARHYAVAVGCDDAGVGCRPPARHDWCPSGRIGSISGMVQIAGSNNFPTTFLAEVLGGTTPATAVCPAGGCEIFVFQVGQEIGSDAVVQITAEGFAGFAADVGIVLPPGSAGTLVATDARGAGHGQPRRLGQRHRFQLQPEPHTLWRHDRHPGHRDRRGGVHVRPVAAFCRSQRPGQSGLGFRPGRRDHPRARLGWVFRLWSCGLRLAYPSAAPFSPSGGALSCAISAAE